MSILSSGDEAYRAKQDLDGRMGNVRYSTVVLLSLILDWIVDDRANQVLLDLRYAASVAAPEAWRIPMTEKEKEEKPAWQSHVQTFATLIQVLAVVAGVVI